MTNPTRHRTARTHALPKGARLVALLGVLLLLVSSCAGVEEPTPDHAAVSARYAHQNRDGQSPETPKTAPAATARPVQSQAAPVQSQTPKAAATKPMSPAPAQAVPAPRPAEPARAPAGAGETPTPTGANPADAPAAPPAPLDNALMDFAGCIRLAVERSPYLKGPSLEIQVKKLDEKDAWYHLFPSLYFTLISDRKIAGADDQNMKVGDSSQTLGLTSGSYNPIAAWIQHDAQKDVTRLTRMSAVLTLQELIQQIATAFIALDTLDRQISLRREVIDLNERALVFATKLENIHTSQIDIKIALQKKNLAQTEYDMAVVQKTQVLMSLRDMLGLGPYDLIRVDADQFNVMLAGYDPDGYRYEYAEKNNIRMQMQEVKNILADKDITAQWIKVLPTFSFGVRQPDKVNTQNSSGDGKDYFFTATMQLPLWQWGESTRAFERAEIKKRQTQYANDVERLRFKSAWMMQQMQAQQQRSLLELAQGEADLAELARQKSQVEYGSGKILYRQLLDAELNVINARIRASELRKNYSTSLLQMVGDTGDLMRRYVNIEDLPDAP